MEKKHAYTVGEAQKLLSALKEGEAFLERERLGHWDERGRKDPWAAYKREGEAAFQQHGHELQQANQELKKGPRDLMISARDDLFEAIYKGEEKSGQLG